jgi:hypothetical protein
MIKRFNRFELKYPIKAELADILAAEFSTRVRPDPEGGPSGTYQVTSLYFDTADARFYHAKVDGLKFRRKLRVRRYGTLTADRDFRVTVEVKQRINRTTQKRRLALPIADAIALCEGSLELTFEDPKDEQVASEVHFLTEALVLRPTCTVSYMRQAFMGSIYEPGLRLTFDRGLWCRHPQWGLGPTGPHYVILPPDEVILEVKANDLVPQWVPRLLATHGVTLSRFSKYCAGLRRLRAQPVVLSAPDPLARKEGL